MMDNELSNIYDYDVCKDFLYLRLINYTDNKDRLKDVIYQKIGDVVLVLSILIHANDIDGLGGIMVSKRIFESWDKELPMVMEIAINNTKRIAPPRRFSCRYSPKATMYKKGTFIDIPHFAYIGPFNSPMITTSLQKEGSIALFYPGIMEEMVHICNGSYFVVFTSIDEVHIHPENTISPHSLLQTLGEMNVQINHSDEILSRNIFFYNVAKHKLEALNLKEVEH